MCNSCIILLCFSLVVVLFLSGVSFILRVLYQSMLPLFYLGRLFLCVMVFFALIGIELFRDGLHYGCFVNYTNSAGMYALYQSTDLAPQLLYTF